MNKGFSFTPDDALAASVADLLATIPPEVLEVWKSTIVDHLTNGQSKFYQAVLIRAFSERMGEAETQLPVPFLTKQASLWIVVASGLMFSVCTSSKAGWSSAIRRVTCSQRKPINRFEFEKKGLLAPAKMMNALAAAVTAFYNALPASVPLKDEIRDRVGKQVSLLDVITAKSAMYRLAERDATGETTFDMVYKDASERCNDQECAASLDRWDIGRPAFYCVVLLSLASLFVWLSTVDRKLESFNGIILEHLSFGVFIAGFVFILLAWVYQNSYQEAVRTRIILERMKKKN